jgi:hypothetical protein
MKKFEKCSFEESYTYTKLHLSRLHYFLLYLTKIYQLLS